MTIISSINVLKPLKTTCISVMLLTTTALVGGCASTATGASQTAIVNSGKTEPLKASAPAGSVLTVIRYPAVVETAAKDKYYDAFDRAAIGGTLSNKSDAAQRQTVADSVVVKSNYFALSLFKEMAARLPEHSVLLSPHAVKLDADGNLTSEPITQAESLPSAVTVDFVTYSYPDPRKMLESEPLTFGDLVTPLVSVHTDRRASAATQGVLFASAPLIPYAAGTGQSDTNTELTTLQNGQFETEAQPLDFISYIAKDNRVNVPTKSLNNRRTKNAIAAYPVEKVKLNKTALLQLNRANDGSIDPLEDVFSNAMADKIVKIINDTDINKAVMASKAAAISKYDQSLAALTFVGSDDPDYNARLRYAERLLDAERKYLSVQSLRIFDGIHNGEMGVQMRDMISAEYKVLEERRRLARKQNEATFFAVLGAVAAGAAIANSGGGRARCNNTRSQRELENCLRRARRTNIGNNILTQLAIQGTVVAATQAINLNSRSKSVGRNYLSSIVPALEQQTTVTVDLLDSSETITAIRYEDLQSKLQELYSSRQRSLDTVASRCTFSHNNGTTGTWMGVCEGGQANGSGAGAIQNTDGTAVEYYGYARGGRANGAGLMIIHGPQSSYSLEGNFVNGEADGAVRVSKPGQNDKLRTYRAGQDVGTASQAPQSLFQTAAIQ